METTAKLFRDVATVAKWYFDYCNFKAGAYTAKDLAELLGEYPSLMANEDSIDRESLPDCAMWMDERNSCVILSYNDGQSIYIICLVHIFGLLYKLSKIVTGAIPAHEKKSLLSFVKSSKVDGELIAVVDLPKKETKYICKSVYNKLEYYYGLEGVCLDSGGYLVSSDNSVMNVLSINAKFEAGFERAVLPVDFVKRNAGKSVSIIKDSYGDMYAVCGGDAERCENNYPNYSRIIGKFKGASKVRVSSKDLIKSCGKEEIKVSFCDEGLQIESDGKTKIMKASHKLTGSYFNLCDCKVKKVIPLCDEMYFRGDGILFVGDRCLSFMFTEGHLCNIDQDSNEDFDPFDVIRNGEVCDAPTSQGEVCDAPTSQCEVCDAPICTDVVHDTPRMLGVVCLNISPPPIVSSEKITYIRRGNKIHFNATKFAHRTNMPARARELVRVQARPPTKVF